jgi:hypothetical protein
MRLGFGLKGRTVTIECKQIYEPRLAIFDERKRLRAEGIRLKALRLELCALSLPRTFFWPPEQSNVALLNNLVFMPESKVIVLQGYDIKKLQSELADVLKNNEQQPASITQSQSSIPVIGSRQGWETMVTFALVFK